MYSLVKKLYGILEFFKILASYLELDK